MLWFRPRAQGIADGAEGGVPALTAAAAPSSLCVSED